MAIAKEQLRQIISENDINVNGMRKIRHRFN